MKRLFGLHRARYFGQAKTHAQLAMAAIGQNLLKAANKITFNPQTPAIAQTETPKSVCPLKQKRGERDAKIKSSAQNHAPAQRSLTGC